METPGRTSFTVTGASRDEDGPNDDGHLQLPSGDHFGYDTQEQVLVVKFSLT